jgi:hypothetical protein
MKHLDTLLQLMRSKAYDHKAKLENSGGGDGPDWEWISGYYAAIQEMEMSVNFINNNSHTVDAVAIAKESMERKDKDV